MGHLWTNGTASSSPFAPYPPPSAPRPDDTPGDIARFFAPPLGVGLAPRPDHRARNFRPDETASSSAFQHTQPDGAVFSDFQDTQPAAFVDSLGIRYMDTPGPWLSAIYVRPPGVAPPGSTVQTTQFTRSSPFRNPDIVFNFPYIPLLLVPTQLIPMMMCQLLRLRQFPLFRLRQLLLHRLRQVLPQAMFEAAANLEEKIIDIMASFASANRPGLEYHHMFCRAVSWRYNAH